MAVDILEDSKKEKLGGGQKEDAKPQNSARKERAKDKLKTESS